MTDNMKCCANCEYWYPYNENDLDGECRRYPPSIPIIEGSDKDVISLSDIYIALIRGTMLVNNPFTFAEEWCGEFKLMSDPRWTDEDSKEDE